MNFPLRMLLIRNLINYIPPYLIIHFDNQLLINPILSRTQLPIASSRPKQHWPVPVHVMRVRSQNQLELRIGNT